MLGSNHVIKSLDKCDFTPMYEWHMAERERKKLVTKEVRMHVIVKGRRGKSVGQAAWRRMAGREEKKLVTKEVRRVIGLTERLQLYAAGLHGRLQVHGTDIHTHRCMHPDTNFQPLQEKAAIKADKDVKEAKYKVAYVDDREEQVGAGWE